MLIPLAVDGAIVVASMSILLANRRGTRGGFLAWAMLMVGSLASLGANIAVAEPSLIGRLIAAWPSAALIGSYELLMSQIRQTPARESPSRSRVRRQGLRNLLAKSPRVKRVVASVRRGIFVEPPGSGPWRIVWRTGRSHRAGSSLSSLRGALDGAAGSSE
ncbi:DUF2637 domain-containing protein [Nonomuraea sp. KM88]|uniref:DUF2637 domain-containing protein n=1 Tax=Nonomuraea sp. KM88 TaxID=3457427 RepID=UPI003FCE1669